MGRNILISGIGKRNHLLDLMAREGAVHDVAVVGADATPLPPARPAVSRFEQLPPASSADFGDRYAEAIARNDVSAFLTIIDPEIPVLGRLASDGLLGAARFVQPDAASSLVCEDKLRFHEVLTAHGVPTIPTASSPLDAFPFIRKDRFGSAVAWLSGAEESRRSRRCRPLRGAGGGLDLPAVLQRAALLRRCVLLS